MAKNAKEQTQAPKSSSTFANKGILYPLIIFITPFFLNWHLFASNLSDRWTVGADSMDSLYGIYKYTADSLSAGTLAQWNHFSFLGHPAFADFEYTPFSPMMWIMTLIAKAAGFDIAFAFMAVVQLPILGIGAYLLVKRITASEDAGLIAGMTALLSYQANFAMFYAFQNIIAVVWMPYLFYFLVGYKETKAPKRILSATAIMGLICLTNILVVLPYVFIILFIFVAISFLDEGYKKALMVFSVVSVAGIALGLASLVPHGVFLGHSARSMTGGWDFSISDIDNPRSFSSAFLFFLNPFFHSEETAWIKIYYGILALFFVIIAVRKTLRGKNRYIIGLLAAFAFTTLFSLGHYFIFNDLVYLFVPVINKMHAHFRILLFLMALFPVLAGIGYQAFVESPANYRPLIKKFFPLMFALSLVPISFMPDIASPSVAGFALFKRIDVLVWMALVFSISWALSDYFAKTGMPRSVFLILIGLFMVLEMGTAERMTLPFEKYRTAGGPATFSKYPANSQATIRDYILPSTYGHSNMNIADKASAWNGYLTTGLKRYFYLLASAGQIINWDRYESVKEVLGKFFGITKEQAQHMGGFANTSTATFFSAPRVSLANRYMRKNGGEMELLEDLLRSDGYSTPLIEGPAAPPPLNPSCDSKGLSVGEDTVTNCSGSVRVARLGYNDITFEVSSKEDALLVWYDNYYPGWKATVDGTASEIYKTNYTFKSVFVPKGEHKVSFRFRDKYMLPSVILSLVAWAILGLAYWKYPRPANLPFQKPK